MELVSTHNPDGRTTLAANAAVVKIDKAKIVTPINFFIEHLPCPAKA